MRCAESGIESKRPMILQSIAHIATQLRDQGIPYCHWKGNWSLAQVLAGEKDFELLVDRKSSNEAAAVLLKAGYKRAVVRSTEALPGVSHYYGLDSPTGRLVHVHFYTMLVTGESFVESHLLPFHVMLLENAEHLGEIRVPSRSAECVCHVVRTLIRYGSPLDLICVSRKLKADEEALRWLKRESNPSEALHLLRTYCPQIDEAMFVKALCMLASRASLFAKLRLARQVRRRLRVFERQSGRARFTMSCRLVWQRVSRRLRGEPSGKTLETGGAVIAIVGADATGKSTLVSECSRWLGSAFAVRTVHAGKPPSAWVTAPINLTLRITRGPRTWLNARDQTDGVSGSPAVESSTSTGLTSLVYALRAVSLAWDRRQLLLRARRAAANGEIVICDRYPSDVVGTMDSPRLHEDATRRGLASAIYHVLARLEHHIYRQIPPPDLVLKLRVSVETAKKRNRGRANKDAESYLEARHQQVQQWCRAGATNIHEIDTEQPLEQTILNVKKLIWESL